MSEGTATVCPEGMESECVWVIFALKGPPTKRRLCSLPLPLRWPLPLPLWNVAVDVGDSPSPSPICPRDVDFAQPGRQLSDGRS
jgi:hypothetical protein